MPAADDRSRPRALPQALPYLAVLILSVVLIGSTLAIGARLDLTTSQLMRDPATTFMASPFIGFLSQIGIFVWAGTAAIALFAAASGVGPATRRLRALLAATGTLTLVLALDDLFLLHEAVLPMIGIPELVTFAGYGVACAAIALGFWREILACRRGLLLMAGLFLGASVGLDLIDPAGIDPYLWEDGAKLVGLVAWFVLHVDAARHAVRCGGEPCGAGCPVARLVARR
ncbi:hypothetical protein J4G33_03905 [Actinotalea sp. BY-33]|uniref:Uncharacterized protein n=1 Tax=Actinotalea soli TaxID=2819234 RepID=A0A939RVA6_9CELL|nr:hypothetical protein [Actinotalea soli]MBO1750941.1 hypothetical protein [Actinotalea soli]